MLTGSGLSLETYIFIYLLHGFSRLDQLCEVSVREMMVSSAGPPGQVATTTPSMCMLSTHALHACTRTPTCMHTYTNMHAHVHQHAACTSTCMHTYNRYRHSYNHQCYYNIADITKLDLSQNPLLSNWEVVSDVASQLKLTSLQLR